MKQSLIFAIILMAFVTLLAETTHYNCGFRTMDTIDGETFWGVPYDENAVVQDVKAQKFYISNAGEINVIQEVDLPDSLDIYQSKIIALSGGYCGDGFFLKAGYNAISWLSTTTGDSLRTRYMSGLKDIQKANNSEIWCFEVETTSYCTSYLTLVDFSNGSGSISYDNGWGKCFDRKLNQSVIGGTIVYNGTTTPQFAFIALYGIGGGNTPDNVFYDTEYNITKSVFLDGNNIYAIQETNPSNLEYLTARLIKYDANGNMSIIFSGVNQASNRPYIIKKLDGWIYFGGLQAIQRYNPNTGVLQRSEVTSSLEYGNNIQDAMVIGDNLLVLLDECILVYHPTGIMSVNNTFMPVSMDVIPGQTGVNMFNIDVSVFEEDVLLESMKLTSLPGDTISGDLENFRMSIDGIQVAETPNVADDGFVYFNDINTIIGINTNKVISFFVDIPTNATVDNTVGLRMIGGSFINATGLTSGIGTYVFFDNEPQIYGNPFQITNTLWVPTQYNSIQSAINAAENGNTVIVEPGSYFESIDFMGKQITVASRFILDPLPEYIQTTVICGTGTNSGSIVKFTNNENSWTQLIGLHIIGGNANGEYPNGYGGGIRIQNSSPTIKDCIISNNHAVQGGGMYIGNGAPRIERCLITENSAGNGGGIELMDSDVQIVNCTIANNIAETPTNTVIYGGLYISSGTKAIVGNSIIWNNKKIFTNSGYEEVANVGFCFAFEADTLVVVASNVQGGSTAIDTENNGTVHWLDWNINQDPLLDQNYKPEVGSPCIDAGHDLFYWNGVQIINLYPNQYYGNSPDMGFWETNFPVSNNDQITPAATNPVLNQNYPNPFNPETAISFNLPKTGEMSLNIYNVKGQLVKTLINEIKTAGTHQIIWNGTDNSGYSVSSGLYYYKMTAGKYSATKKMIMMK